MMRMAILLLVLANIVLFLWLNAPKSPERAVKLSDPEVGRLLLANEAETELDGSRYGSTDALPEDESIPEPSPGAGTLQAVPMAPILADESFEPGVVAPQSSMAVSAVAVPPNEEAKAVELPGDTDLETPAADIETGPPQPIVAVAERDNPTESLTQAGTDSVDDTPLRPIVDVEPVRDDPPAAEIDTSGETSLAATVVAQPSSQALAEEPAAGPEQIAADTDQAGEAGAAVADTAPDEPGEDAVVPPRPSVCARVGPLSDEEADGLVKVMPVYVRLLSDVSEEYSEIDRYYVMIPALPSRSAGRQKLAELEAAGFSDTWLFPSGQYRNAISLGFFRFEPRATRHADRVRSAGFDAVVEPRVSQREGRWLILENVDGGAIELTLPLPENAAVSPQPCPGG